MTTPMLGSGFDKPSESLRAVVPMSSDTIAPASNTYGFIRAATAMAGMMILKRTATCGEFLTQSREGARNFSVGGRKSGPAYTAYILRIRTQE